MPARGADRFTVQTDPRRPRWAPTPEALLFDRAVSDRATRLWGILDRIAAGRIVAIDSRAGLAEALDCSLSSLDRARGELETAGWLGVERVDGEASRYTPFDRKTITATLVTGDDAPNGCSHQRGTPPSRVTRGVSSRVTTEERERSREGETPNPPQSGGHICEAGEHTRPARGCCTDRARRLKAEQAARDRRAEADRTATAELLAAQPERDPEVAARGLAAAREALAARKRTA